MSDIGTKEAAERWGYTPDTIRKWCANGLIPNATHDGKGSPWHIPEDAVCPKKVKKKDVKKDD